MAEQRGTEIVLHGAETHNLQGIDLRIPRRSLTVITGVSGSGKSSLAFDTLFREGQRRFLETLPDFARRFAGGFTRPAVRSIEGLGPAVALGQRVGQGNPRSTVGTLTEGWDLLRLLFARLGRAPDPIRPSRGLFSFNHEEGACPRCQGLGLEDTLDLDLLIADPAKTLREGALRVSTPNGYLMYSQVTLAVLDEVLRAHGGSVDQPWQDLSEEVRQVVLHGSSRLKVPYGKHPLESRLKWTGITARPRPEGCYRGLVPVMEEILRGKRNDSILRFVRSATCPACLGTRLRPEALAVTWHGRRIVDFAALTARDLRAQLAAVVPAEGEAEVLQPIRAELLARCDLLEELGLGYLSLDRPAPSLSRGELQRMRLTGLALGDLRGLLVVLDEPSAGLHPAEVGRLLQVLRRLRDQGQTVVAVEHDRTLARAADWLVDLGPGPGREGGRLLWSGPPEDLLAGAGGDRAARTRRWLAGAPSAPAATPRTGHGSLRLSGLHHRNLQDLDVELALGALNVVSGVSGAGKTALLEAVAQRVRAGAPAGAPFHRVVSVDADPIGRTPRSNPATYSGAFDLVRDLFADTAEARRRGFGKGRFTFNTAGGRCEACEGAGVVEVGMRYLGSVEQVCETCGGRRFHADVLAVTYRGRSIADVLEGSLAEAVELFADQPRLRRLLDPLMDVGLGYLALGQPATTLSGGEAQRVKLASELAKAGGGPALILLDEPSTGLHSADVAVLLAAWERLLDGGHTLLVADHDLEVLRRAGRILDLGPGGGPEGGRLVAAGTAADLTACAGSATGAALRGERTAEPPAAPPGAEPPIELRGVRSHNLQGFTAAIPARGLTVVAGPSGSGKSSLVFDTLLAEARARVADLVSPWARRLLPRTGGADLESASGLQVTIAVPPGSGRRNPRATLATTTELDALFRLLFARAGLRDCPACSRAAADRCGCGEALPVLWASHFSANGEAGACPRCRGLGFLQRCDPDRLVSHPDLSLDGGAMAGTRFGAYLGEADGQHVATLRAAAQAAGLDIARPWRALAPAAHQLAMHGSGDLEYAVAWHYRRGRSEGVHRLQTRWVGFADLVDQEYERIHADPRGDELADLLVDAPCPSCTGERLNPAARAVRFGGLRLPEWNALPLGEVQARFESLGGLDLPAGHQRIAEALREDILRRLRALAEAGLTYLTMGREMASLSGGEAQRVRLAAALGGGLVGVTYVLDEPTRGLHPRDVQRLLGVLKDLAAAGNAVVVVEHEEAVIAAADHLIELGPGAGPEGGRLLAAGPPAARHRQPGPWAAVPPVPPGSARVGIRGARLHNLLGLDAEVPLGSLVALTGVSGSGKSTLLMGVLAPSLIRRQRGLGPAGCAALDLPGELGDVHALDQGGLGLGAASTVLTLAGLGEGLRKRFAATPRARELKLGARAFSTALPGGRCEACEGRGVLTVAMDLLPDVTVGCAACDGQRFKPEVLECRLDGLTIAETLAATVAEQASRSGGDPGLAALVEVGLGYLKLGQEGTALSAGEGQRLRLAQLLARPRRPSSAILLDEPTRGLGSGDVARLAGLLRRLAREGHLVVAVEHDPRFIAGCDWVIDLGPEGGAGGGRVVVAGTPAQVAACPGSHTGRALAGC